MDIRITRGRLCGTLRAPDSKSDAHRALIAMALCPSPSRLHLSTRSDDILATVDCLRALGADIREEEDGCSVHPGRAVHGAQLDCGESGSTLRFLLPVAAALGTETHFCGHGRLPERPLEPLLSELRRHGAEITGDRLPLTVRGSLSGGAYSLPGNVSSQFITGLLLALPLLGKTAEIRLTSPLESAAYVAMTRHTLHRFGVDWMGTESGFSLPAGSAYRSPGAYTAEGDWSGAGFPLVAGALGGEVTVTGLAADSLQPDRAILSCLRESGARLTETPDGITVQRGTPRPFQADVSACPDAFPILAVLAAGAPGDSLLSGAARLRLKESDRIRAVAELLRALGGHVTEGTDYLRIHGTGSLRGGTVEGCGDHRIVMAAAVASALCPEPVTIRGAEAHTKSYPGFFDDFKAMGGVYAIL